jgi:hypothetical protein
LPEFSQILDLQIAMSGFLRSTAIRSRFDSQQSTYIVFKNGGLSFMFRSTIRQLSAVGLCLVVLIGVWTVFPREAGATPSTQIRLLGDSAPVAESITEAVAPVVEAVPKAAPPTVEEAAKAEKAAAKKAAKAAKKLAKAEAKKAKELAKAEAKKAKELAKAEAKKAKELAKAAAPAAPAADPVEAVEADS